MKAPSSSRVRLAVVGCGARGTTHLLALHDMRGVEVAAVADLYDGYLRRAQEIWGSQLVVTRDYRVLLSRADIDAVVLAVPDFAHQAIFTAAVAAGKDVYCEAPFSYSTAAGVAMRAAAEKAKAIVQVGSGMPSLDVCQRAREIVASGQLGQIYLITGVHDAAAALASWRTPYPPDASPDSIDWAAFQEASPRRYPFDLQRFFCWRCFWDYGAGMAGDALIAALTAVHWITGCGAPVRVQAGGGVFRWRDGRETPDVFHADFDYAAGFSLHLNATMTNSRRGHSLRFCGSDASLVLEARHGAAFDSLSLLPEPQVEPYVEASLAWPAVERQWFYMMHGLDGAGQPRRLPPPVLTDQYWEGNADAATLTKLHLANFLTAVRTRQTAAEPATLGEQAANAAHMANAAFRQWAALQRQEI